MERPHAAGKRKTTVGSQLFAASIRWGLSSVSRLVFVSVLRAIVDLRSTATLRPSRPFADADELAGSGRSFILGLDVRYRPIADIGGS